MLCRLDKTFELLTSWVPVKGWKQLEGHRFMDLNPRQVIFFPSEFPLKPQIVLVMQLYALVSFMHKLDSAEYYILLNKHDKRSLSI